MPVIPGRTRVPALRLPRRRPPAAQPTCETAGVLNVIVSAVASIQVADALKILCGRDVRARITTMDVWNGGIRQIDAPPRDPECPVLRPPRVPVPGGVEPCAGDAVRPQCRAGCGPAPSIWRTWRRDWRRSARCGRTSIAVRFAVRAVRDDDLRGRPRDRQRHQRYRASREACTRGTSG